MLRVSVWSSSEFVKKTLRKATSILFQWYPNSTIYCQISANAVLYTPERNSWSIYFGQRFGGSKSVHFAENKSEFYELNDVSDAERLPTNFSTEDFRHIFNMNFETSAVKIDSICSLIYKFSKGFDDFSSEKTTGPQWVELF